MGIGGVPAIPENIRHHPYNNQGSLTGPRLPEGRAVAETAPTPPPPPQDRSKPIPAIASLQLPQRKSAKPLQTIRTGDAETP